MGAMYAELKRRGVLRVAGIYIVAGWVAIQACDILYQPLGFEHSPVRAVIIIALIGFPFAIGAAWFFNVSRDRQADVSDLTPAQSRLALIASLGVGMIVLIFGGWLALRPAGSTRKPDIKPASMQPDHIAVLYFKDGVLFSPDDAYIGSALTETLIEQLSSQDALTVISGNGVRQFENDAVPPDSIARSLNVGTIVDGTVMTTRDSVVVRITVIGPDGAVLKPYRIASPRGSSLVLADDVARDVSDFLRERIGDEVNQQRWERGTQNDSAWGLVKRSVRLEKLSHAVLEKDGPDAAVEILLRADSLAAAAERLDPAYSDATIRRAWYAYGRAFYSFNPAHQNLQRMNEAFDEGYAHATRALVRHPADAQAMEVRGALAKLQLTLTPGAAANSGLLAQAEQDLRNASMKDPGRARALSNLSDLLQARGDYTQASAYAKMAYDADAYLEDVNILNRLFKNSFETGHDADARKWCDEAVRRRRYEPPSAFCTLELMAWSKLAQPSIPDAWAIVESTAAQPPMGEYYRPHLEVLASAVIARAGKPDSARAVLTRALARNTPDPEMLLLEAGTRVILNENDSARALVARYLESNPAWRGILEKSRRFAQLRTAPVPGTPAPGAPVRATPSKGPTP
jgi:TolB-like protein/Tfp pilus assembly protein PilF